MHQDYLSESGAGRSMLMRLINRLIEPTQGSIDYRDVTSPSSRGGGFAHGERAAAIRLRMLHAGATLAERLAAHQPHPNPYRTRRHGSTISASEPFYLLLTVT
jgi:ABC-type glutathione transport system ATPase component